MIEFRRWLSRKFYLWSCRIYEDWHEVELTAAGERTVAIAREQAQVGGAIESVRRLGEYAGKDIINGVA